MFFDTHCHLSFSGQDYTLDEMIVSAQKAAVTRMVTIGAGEGVEGNIDALKIAEKFSHVWATVGIHPHDAKLVTPEVLEQMRTLLLHPRVVAVGEVGLDFHYLHSPQEIQEKVFDDFISLAIEFKKPLVIHDRDADLVTYNHLQVAARNKVPILIHCFTGTADLAKKYLDLGCLISFSGIITFKNAEALREIVKWIPKDRILIETDSPFLAPVPYRGKKNQPAFVVEVARCISQIWNTPLEEVAQITTQNANQFFGLSVDELKY